MTLMRRGTAMVAAVVLGLTGLAVTAAPASANVTLGRGWSIWTREYCEDGSLVGMRYLTFTGRGTQGREYVYRRGGRLCAFTNDHLAGSHWIDISAKYDKQWGVDSGYYTEYAGALAGPAGRCIAVMSSLQVPSGGKVYLYGTTWKTYC